MLSTGVPSSELQRTMERLGIVLNPRAGHGKSEHIWKKLELWLRSKFGEGWEMQRTKKQGDGSRLASEFVDKGCTIIIAVGGDGTLNEVINGYVKSDGLSKGASVALVPAGTGGDFRRTLFKNAMSLEASFDRLIHGERTLYDIGLVKCSSNDGSPVERFFINIAGIGVDAVIVKKLSETVSILPGSLVYLYHTFAEGLKYQCKRVRAWLFDEQPNGFGREKYEHYMMKTRGRSHSDIKQPLDSNAQLDLRIFVLAVCNGQYFGGGMRMAPMADPTDGKLDIVVLQDVSCWQLLTRQQQIRSGDHIKSNDNVFYFRASGIRTESDDSGVDVEADGEYVGHVPAEFHICQAAVRLVV